MQVVLCLRQGTSAVDNEDDRGQIQLVKVVVLANYQRV